MKNTHKKSRRDMQYPATYLAVILCFVILIEGFLMGLATNPEMSRSLKVLDISTGVQVFKTDAASAVTPFMEQYKDITKFYNMAATEMIAILDASEMDPLMFPRGVTEFYHLAAVEMKDLLDFSDDLAFIPQVAGASIHR